MKRRDFLKRTSLVSGALLVPQFLSAYNTLKTSIATHKRLVIIQLSGGNDGLNTVVPFRNDIYYRERSGLAISSKEVLPLNDELGFHTSLKSHKDLFDSGYLTILNGVGYPNPNRSHFRATDIWHSASDAKEYMQTGWVGRYMDLHNKKNTIGIEIDDSLSMLMKGEKIDGLAVSNEQILYRTTNDPYFKELLKHHTDTHLSEHNLGYLYKTMIEARSSANYIHETTRLYNSSTSYPNTIFGKQLKSIAKFINSGLDTEIYYASLGGFDTHANQAAKQKRLLQVYDDGIDVFVKDLKQQGTFKDTLIMVFSEFGRRVQQNAANGTDHGTANQVYLIGEKLKTQGLYNSIPSLQDLDSRGDMRYQIDFRSIYASILNQWLQADDQSVLQGDFKKLLLV